MKSKNPLLKKEVTFTAQRIIVGNPVTGILLSEDDEWIEVKLTKDLEGLATVWYSGDKKQFRKSLINGKISLLTKAKTNS